MKVISRLW